MLQRGDAGRAVAGTCPALARLCSAVLAVRVQKAALQQGLPKWWE